MPKAEETKAPAEGQPHREERLEGKGPGPAAPAAPPARAAWGQAHAGEMAATDSHPAVPCPPEHAAPQAPAGAPAGRLVVLCGRLGSAPGWAKGDVIDAGALGDHANVARLVRQGDVRAATDDEAAQERVTLQGAPAPSFEKMVSDAARERDELKAENYRLRDELAHAKRAQGGATPALGGAEQLKLAAEKDRAIEQLQARVRELEAQQGADEGDEGRKGRGRR
jgi:hypothetical protein